MGLKLSPIPKVGEFMLPIIEIPNSLGYTGSHIPVEIRLRIRIMESIETSPVLIKVTLLGLTG